MPTSENKANKVKKMDKKNKIKVLFIAGTGRNGSTLLEKVLSQIDNFFSVGEIHNIWERGVIQDQLCGCGVRHSHCAMWKRIHQNAYGQINIEKAKKWYDIKQKSTKLRRVFSHIVNYDHKTDITLNEYLNTLDKLYCSVALCANCEVIIDSSKSPMYLALLRLLPSLDVYTLHVVRDPRAVTYSWLNPKPSNDPYAPPMMGVMQLWTSIQVWNIWNMLIEYFGRKGLGNYLFLRYEDFVAHPSLHLNEIQEFLDLNNRFNPLNDSETISVKKTHTISGNPLRFETGTIKISEDRRWRNEMKNKDKAIVTALSFPLMLRYSYTLR
jgi:sulfotransferase family protein